MLVAALMMGFTALKAASRKWENEGGSILLEAVHVLQGAMIYGRIEFDYQALLDKLS